MAKPATGQMASMIAAQTLHWREPLWLMLGLYPLVMLLMAYAIRRWRTDRYADAGLLPWVVSVQRKAQRQIGLRHLASLLAWSCFAIAMAGPRIAEKIYQTDHANYAEVMIVLDLSQSMAAKDLLPNRLQRARVELLDFLQRADQSRIGLTVFAARPHLLSPMTHDKEVIEHYLTALKPALLPTAGSNINDALMFASQYFTPSQTSSRAILLISDGDSGESIQNEKQINTAQHLKQLGIPVYSLGIGTLAGQVVVTELDPRYANTQSSLTTLQRAPLQQIAYLTSGSYVDVSDDNSDWQQLNEHGLAKLTHIKTAHQKADNNIVWQELYHLPLILAFIFFMLALLAPGRTRLKPHPTVTLAVLTGLLITSSPQIIEAAESSYALAYQAYQAGAYKKARQLFAQIPGYAARLGEASSFYQEGDYSNARNTYIQAILAASTDQQRATALFNLANTYYQLKDFAHAQQFYRDVLHYQPRHPAAKNNISHAIREQRLKEAEDALTYRSGRGPRTGRAAEELDLSNTQVSLGDSASDDDLTLPTPDKNHKTSATILEQVALASQQVETDADTDWTYQLTNIAALQTHQQNLRSNSSHVWRRLFEQEEGFPAPVLLPHPVPGVSPW